MNDSLTGSGAAPTADAVSGTVLGKCRLTRELGRGGMGSVWLAEHTTLGVNVAVKVLPPAVAAKDPQFAARFLREARLAARLRHPNVVAVMDADRDAATGLHYIVQEFCSGGSVRDRLRRGPMQEADALRVVRDVARALVAAGKAGIVHRDIKPDNILVDDDGNARLADLGLARLTAGHPASDDEQLTASEATLGTPAYMPPEQVDDARNVDARSDIYSLGATLFHLLAGRPPFVGDSLYQLMHRIVTEPAPDVRDLRADVTAGSAGLCRRMLEKDPAARPQSAAELLEAIDQHETPPRGTLPPLHAAVPAVPAAGPKRSGRRESPGTVAPDNSGVSPTVPGNRGPARSQSARSDRVPRTEHRSPRGNPTLADAAADTERAHLRRQTTVVAVVALVGMILLVALIVTLRSGNPPPDPQGNSTADSHASSHANRPPADAGNTNRHAPADPPPPANNTARNVPDPQPRPPAEDVALARDLRVALAFDHLPADDTAVPDLAAAGRFARAAQGLQSVTGHSGTGNGGIRLTASRDDDPQLAGAGPLIDSTAFTVAFWLAPDSDTAMTVLDIDTTQSRMQGLLVGTFSRQPEFGHWRTAVGNGPGFVVGFWEVDVLVPAATDGWHHLAVVIDGRRVQVFLDGRARDAHLVDVGGEVADRGTGPFALPAAIRTPRSRLRLGGLEQPFAGLPPFSGRLDEFAIWGRALSAVEVQRVASLPDICSRLAAASAAGNR